jgi:hypothetical protein
MIELDFATSLLEYVHELVHGVGNWELKYFMINEENK